MVGVKLGLLAGGLVRRRLRLRVHLGQLSLLRAPLRRQLRRLQPLPHRLALVLHTVKLSTIRGKCGHCSAACGLLWTAIQQCRQARSHHTTCIVGF